MRRPSPALIVAIVALVVACAGSATAATLITGRDIRNNSVTGADIRDRSLRGKDVGSNTITGRNVDRLSGRDVIPNGLDGSDIDENTLETVPSATRADSLTHVAIRRIVFSKPAGTASATLLDEGGLRITAACSVAGRLTATVVPTGAGSGALRITVTHPGAATTGTTSLVADNAFVGTDSASLVPGGGANATGTLTFWGPDSQVTTLQYLVHETDGCTLAGNLVRTSP